MKVVSYEYTLHKVLSTKKKHSKVQANVTQSRVIKAFN